MLMSQKSPTLKDGNPNIKTTTSIINRVITMDGGGDDDPEARMNSHENILLPTLILLHSCRYLEGHQKNLVAGKEDTCYHVVFLSIVLLLRVHY